jgi:hypothetical protein
MGQRGTPGSAGVPGGEFRPRSASRGCAQPSILKPSLNAARSHNAPTANCFEKRKSPRREQPPKGPVATGTQSNCADNTGQSPNGPHYAAQRGDVWSEEPSHATALPHLRKRGNSEAQAVQHGAHSPLAAYLVAYLTDRIGSLCSEAIPQSRLVNIARTPTSTPTPNATPNA